MKAVVDVVSTFLFLANQGLMNVYFGDESGFSLQSNVPMSWQKKGTQLGIPSLRTRVMNVLGFLNPLNSHLVTYEIPKGEKMDSSIFIQFLSDFASKITLPTAVVLDNASWHKSVLTRAMFEEWEKQGLYIVFLPPRSPHLNLIETLWRKIKNEWLAVADFRSEKAMREKITYILQHYGEKYDIHFSMDKFKHKANK